MRCVTFEVPGRPVSKGSMRAMLPKGAAAPVIIPNNQSLLRSWEATVRQAAASAWQAPPTRDLVSLRLEFRLPRPKAHYRRNGIELRHDAPCYVGRKPDLDKLTRAVCDALEAVVVIDDEQVCELHSLKRFDDTPGVVVTLSTLSNGEPDMTDLMSECYPSPWMAAADLAGGARAFTIDRVETDLFDQRDGTKKRKPVVYWREAGVKPWIVNKTNCKFLSDRLGDSMNWPGARVRLSASTVRVAGEMKDTIVCTAVQRGPAPPAQPAPQDLAPEEVPF